MSRRSAPRPGRRAGRVVLLLATAAVAATLAACDGGFFGERKKKPPLPGERISVLQLERQIAPDPRIAKLAVRLPRPVANEAWPQAGGRPDHVMQHLQAADEIRVAWRVDVGSGSSDAAALVSPPIVAAGRVVVIDAAAVVSAWEAGGGGQLWRVDTRPEGDSSAVAGGGVAAEGERVYVATGYAEVLALDLATGEEVWRERVPGPVRGSPTIADGRIFVVTVDNQTIALDADDGRRLWSHSGISEVAGLLGGASPAVEGGTVIAPYSSGELYALRVENGRIVWSENLTAVRRVEAVSTLADIRGRPVVDRGLVVAASHSGRTAAIDLRTGARAWERGLGSVHQPWIAGDFVFVATLENELVCLTRREGRVRWVRELERWEQPDKKSGPIWWAGPVLVGDRLLLAGSNGRIEAVSPYTGEALGSLALGDKVFIAPIVANGTVYVLADDATLIALR